MLYFSSQSHGKTKTKIVPISLQIQYFEFPQPVCGTVAYLFLLNIFKTRSQVNNYVFKKRQSISLNSRALYFFSYCKRHKTVVYLQRTIELLLASEYFWHQDGLD